MMNFTINNITIPSGAKFILSVFPMMGYKAYLVGGCCRDAILNKEPHDWDICTNATPEEMMWMVKELNRVRKDKPEIKTIPTGMKHGTITIVIDDEPYEVTTFRQDGEYSDGRRPDDVSFTKNLLDDLQRRDFTINAIAFSPYEGFIDPFNGIQDIENKTIKCVGNPNDRFNEDGLRILRAIRFAAQLEFTINDDTTIAIHENKHLLDKISKERINSELCKILNSNNCGNQVLREYADVLCQFIPQIRNMIGFEQNNPYHPYDVWEHTLHCMNYLSRENPNEPYNDIITRLAVLLHDIGKPNCYVIDDKCVGHFYGHAKESTKIAYDILTDLRFSNEIVDKTVELISYHDIRFTTTKASVKRLLNKLEEKQFRRLLQLRRCDIIGQNLITFPERALKVCNIENILNEIIEEKECFCLKDLAINGKDLIEHGIKEGKLIGEILNTLLTMVIDGDTSNEKEYLLQIIDNVLLNGR